jgi:hypothetical protein
VVLEEVGAALQVAVRGGEHEACRGRLQQSGSFTRLDLEVERGW